MWRCFTSVCALWPEIRCSQCGEQKKIQTLYFTPQKMSIHTDDMLQDNTAPTSRSISRVQRLLRQLDNSSSMLLQSVLGACT